MKSGIFAAFKRVQNRAFDCSIELGLPLGVSSTVRKEDLEWRRTSFIRAQSYR